MSGARAAARLVASVVHGLHALGVVLVRFPRYDAARRREAIRWWSATMLERMGVALVCEGVPADGGVLLVANHVSWLDILAVHAVCPRASFVSKADVGRWPLVSRLATAADTVYLERERKRDARRVVHDVAEQLAAGRMVSVFPEGTTGDGRTLLPFHANLLQAAIATGASVQPMALRYADGDDRHSAAVEFVGATTLLQSVWRVASADGLVVHVRLLPARGVAGARRRALAAALRAEIAAAAD